MENNEQLTTIHSLIRETRKRKYKNAKEFWDVHQEEIKVSYPHYAAIETGKKFPDIQLTIAIAKSLKSDARVFCHLWAKDQMPDAESRSYFEPTPGTEFQGLPTWIQAPLDEFYVFTDAQIPAFSKYPKLWDVLMMILAYSLSNPINADILKKALSLGEAEVKGTVDWLRNEGLVKVEDEKLIARRRFYHLPNNAEFKIVRDINFRNATTDLINKITPEDLEKKESYRQTFTRRVTRVQAKELSEHIDKVISHFGNFDDLGTELYTLAVGFGPRVKVEPKRVKNKESEKVALA